MTHTPTSPTPTRTGLLAPAGTSSPLASPIGKAARGGGPRGRGGDRGGRGLAGDPTRAGSGRLHPHRPLSRLPSKRQPKGPRADGWPASQLRRPLPKFPYPVGQKGHFDKRPREASLGVCAFFCPTGVRLPAGLSTRSLPLSWNSPPPSALLDGWICGVSVLALARWHFPLRFWLGQRRGRS